MIVSMKNKINLGLEKYLNVLKLEHIYAQLSPKLAHSEQVGEADPVYEPSQTSGNTKSAALFQICKDRCGEQ